MTRKTHKTQGQVGRQLWRVEGLCTLRHVQSQVPPSPQSLWGQTGGTYLVDRGTTMSERDS